MAIAEAAPRRLWDELAGLTMGSSLETVKGQLRAAKLKSLKVGKPKGASALREKVSFEGHTQATVTYRFFNDKLYEVALQYLQARRAKKVISFLQKKFGEGKKRGGGFVFSSGGRAIAYRSPGGKPFISFALPEILEEVRAAARPPPPVAKIKAKKKTKERTKAAEPSAPRSPKSKRKIIAQRSEDPALWDALGVQRGPITFFDVPVGGENPTNQLVAVGFTRASPIPLGAIVSRRSSSYQVVYIGPACDGTAEDAEPVDFRLDGSVDIAVHFQSSGEPRLALLPSSTRFASAQFIGGRFAGKSVFACHRLGGDLQRIDFIDVDRDRALDLLLTYKVANEGPVHDIYFFQGADFYFREKRSGIPQGAP
jgi:hypothetical protein